MENISEKPDRLLNPAQLPMITAAAKSGLVRNIGVQQTGTKKKIIVNTFIVAEVELRLHMELIITPIEETNIAVVDINNDKGIKTRTFKTPSATKTTR